MLLRLTALKMQVRSSYACWWLIKRCADAGMMNSETAVDGDESGAWTLHVTGEEGGLTAT